ncbi:hypothetical protein [Okeania sp. SIO2B3]|uniref:hypothetical protein n=1 Tax=Okeania sp. SIO2B3 TaxID=2607784 RepID=UPI0013C12AA9|nr:hypothetical protein [Okeania sp. SIO2B3]NET46287.1 hypothetical protein [Okeania sp. SIO2B3]
MWRSKVDGFQKGIVLAYIAIHLRQREILVWKFFGVHLTQCDSLLVFAAKRAITMVDILCTHGEFDRDVFYICVNFSILVRKDTFSYSAFQLSRPQNCCRSNE